jgi:streptogramin lyase
MRNRPIQPMHCSFLAIIGSAAVLLAACGGGGSTPAPGGGGGGGSVRQPSYSTYVIPGLASGYSGQAVYRIAPAADGSVWFGGEAWGEFSGGSFSYVSTDVGIDGGAIAVGRGADGDAYTGDIGRAGPAREESDVRNRATNAAWTLPSSCLPQDAPHCAVPTGHTPVAVLAGPDGATWALTAFELVRLNADGSTSVVPLPSANPNAGDVAVGSDGAFWVTEPAEGLIERVPTSGTATTVTTGGHPSRIAAGPDGALWYLDTAGSVRRLTTSGAVSTVVALVDGGVTAFDAIVSSGGALWYTEENAGKLARVTTSGSVTEFAVPPAGSAPVGLSTAPDGSLWFIESTGAVLVHATF